MTTAHDAVAAAARRSNWSERFIQFAPWLLDRETVFAKGHWGDYAWAIHEDDPNDKGGRTKFGIDQRSHKRTDIAALTVDDALEIYWHTYWLPSLADQCPRGYGEIACDIRVNNGAKYVWKIIQRGLRDAGEKLDDDGAYGRMTAAAMARVGPRGLSFVLDRRERYYREVAKKPGNAGYLRGWINRNNSLRRLVGA